MAWNESSHPRGPGGRFALLGGLHIYSPEGGGRPGANRTRFGRAANAFRPPRSNHAARDRHFDITDTAGDVRRTYAAVQRGTATFRQREDISYQSPSKREESRARTGDVIMPIHEAMTRETSVKRMRVQAPRVAAKTTFTGKRRAVRGYDVPTGSRPTGEARRIMALGK